MKKFYSALFVISVVLSSCVRDEYNLDEINATLSPEVAVPFLKASIVAEDILSAVDSSMLREDANKLLEFVYSDTVYSFGLTEFIDIPDENVNYDFQLDPLYIDDIDGKVTAMTVDTMVDRVGFPYNAIFNAANDGSCDNVFPPFMQQVAGGIDLEITDAPFSTATFSDGVLKVNIENKWPVELTDIELELVRVSDNFAIDTLRFASIPANTSLADSILMEGKTIESAMVANFINLSSPGSIGNVCIDGSDSLLITMSGYDFVVVSGTAVFPNQDFLNDTIEVDLELGNGEEFETLRLKSGNLSLNLDYGIEEAAKVYIELPYATKDGTSFEGSVSVGPTSVIDTVFDLSGYEFDLTKNGTGFNAIQTVIKASIVSSGSEVDFDTSNVVIANVSIENIVPEYIDGYFGNQTITMDVDTQDFGIEASDLFSNMSFVNPTISLQFHNTFGIPIEVSSLNLKMQKGDESETLNSTSVIPFEIAGADISNQSQTVTSELLLGENTNIADLINLWPNEVITGLSGQINPNGNTQNFASENSELDVTLGLTVPVYGQISALTIKQYIAVDSSMSETFKNVVRASLRSNVDNGFPLEAEIKFYLADADTLILDSLVAFDGNQVLVNAGTVNGTGDVVTRGSRQADLIADEADIALLQDGASFIIIEAVMNTANSGSDVKIYSDYDMLIKIGLLAKLKIELNSDKEDQE